MEDGKIVADFPNYRHTSEICGGKLVEVSSQISRFVYKKKKTNKTNPKPNKKKPSRAAGLKFWGSEKILR